MEELLKKYQTHVDGEEIGKKVRDITRNITSVYNVQNLKKIFSSIDFTILNTTDTADDGKKIAETVSRFRADYREMPNVAAICVYPTLVASVKENLTAKGVNIISVVGGFPSAQTFMDIKLAETNKVIELGADEAETVISVGNFLSGNYQTVSDEIKGLKKTAKDAMLNVILETGVLENHTNIKIASFISMESGADFIKTSTEKMNSTDTFTAVYVMAIAIKEFYEKTGKKIGLKLAGGIADVETALKYFVIVKTILGEEWLAPQYFRIGANGLANNILTTINKMTTEERKEIKYF